jgi:hypothetical protein
MTLILPMITNKTKGNYGDCLKIFFILIQLFAKIQKK